MYERFIKVFNAIEAKGYYRNKGRTEGAMHYEKIGKPSTYHHSTNRFSAHLFIMALVTGEWRYMITIPPALMSCWTALFVLRKQEER